MLERRPRCERCDLDLAANGERARIAAFERTFCTAFAQGALVEACPIVAVAW